MKAQVRKALRSLALRVPQIRVVHEQLLTANKSMADLRYMNERLRSTNAAVGVQLTDLSQDHARAQRELNELRAELGTVLAAQQLSRDQLKTSARELQDLHSQLAELADLKADLAAAEDAKAVLRSELEAAVEAARNAARTEELTEVLRRERARAAALASDFSRLQRLVSIAQEENARLTKNLVDLQKSSVDGAIREQAAHDRADKLQRDLTVLSQEIEHARAAYQTAESRAVAAEKLIQKLEGHLEQTANERDSAAAQIRELSTFVQKLKQDLAVADLETRRLAEAEARVEDLARCLVEAQTRILGREQDLEAARQSAADLKAELDETGRRLNLAKDGLSEARSRTEELEAEITRQRDELESLRQELAATRALADEEKAELEARSALQGMEHSATKVQVAELRSALEAALLRAESAETRSEEAQRFVLAAQGQVMELSERSALAEQALAGERLRKEEVVLRALELEKTIAHGQEALRAAEAAHQADKLEAQGELAQLAAEVEYARRSAIDLQGLVDRNRLEIEVVEARAAESNRKLAEVEAQLGDLTTLQARIAILEAELGSQRDELNATENSRAALQRERDQLAYQLKVQMPETLARILGKITKAEETFERERKPTPRAITLQDPAAIAAGLRDRYLDLLEGALTGTLYEDAPMSPWSSGYDQEVRSLGRDWPARALTMIGTTRMRNIRRVMEEVLAREVPGDFIETGVWRGGACIYARGILAAHGVRDRKVWVADSFRGLPPPSPDAYPEDRDDPHHTYEELRVSLNQVRQNFRDYGLLDDQVQFLKGWFSETLAKAPIERLAVLRLDGDMYESTIQALDALYRKVSVGGYVIVDDYGLGPCKKAVDDFRAGLGIEDAILEIDGAAIYWRKTVASEAVGDRKLASVPKQV